MGDNVMKFSYPKVEKCIPKEILESFSINEFNNGIYANNINKEIPLLLIVVYLKILILVI